MQGDKPISTPMSTPKKLYLGESAPFLGPKKYQSLVGTLKYLALTRPDLAYATYKLSQFSHAPTLNHWLALKRVIHY